MLIDYGETKEELPEEKNHMLGTSYITTVWGGMELAAPDAIEEDNVPPASPSWLVNLLNQNLTLTLLVKI